ncbi:MAG: exodeoxyribonuclease VII large subunit [Parvibaculales bacterium]
MSQDNLTEYSVSELSGAVKKSIEEGFGYVRVRGELGRVSRPQSGHLYVDLKDEKAVLAAVIWKGVAQKMTIQPEQGLEVICTGKLTTFPGQSRYQLVIDHIEPAGIGALMALLEERKKTLSAEGLFDAARKKPIPYLPDVIGVITSPSGAVIRDILHRLKDRFPRPVLVWPVRVQGETCAQEVAQAIAGFNALKAGGDIARPDVIIIARGGGSLEDLWGFNEEIVARTVAQSDIPIISAVGHETDVTLVDYVADLRAPTPTAAAEMAVPVRAELQAQILDLGKRQLRGGAQLLQNRRQQLDGLSRGLPKLEDILAVPRQKLDYLRERLDLALTHQTEKQKTRLDQFTQRLSLRMVAQSVSTHQTRIQDFHARLERRQQEGLNQRRTKLASISKQLNLLSHESVLARGFALVMDSAGQAVRKAAQVPVGGVVTIHLAQNEHLQAEVTDAKTDMEPKPEKHITTKQTLSSKVKKTDKTDEKQGDLF